MATMDKSGASVFEPKDAGTYPVAMLLHGFLLRNHYYQHFLRHVASHGYITVAPQFSVSNSLVLPLGDGKDIAAAARVADWLPGVLPSVLPDAVEPELSGLALAGHSRVGHMAFALVLGYGALAGYNRGGHTAFTLALGYGETETRLLSFSALIGLDPVAGAGRNAQLLFLHMDSDFDVLGLVGFARKTPIYF